MRTRRATPAELRQGISLQTGFRYTIVVARQVFCARLTGMLFDFDKTFLLPSALRGVRALKQYYDNHPGLSVLIVGHTDGKGEPNYNVALSKERAQVMAWFLRDDVDGWLSCYRAGRPAGRKWGSREDQLLLSALAGYDGNIDGKIGPRSREAVKRFQADAGLAATGEIDGATRQELVTRYLQQDGTSLPEGTSLSVHGAGAYHPAFDEASGGEGARHRNRRVETFLFEGPISPPPGAPQGPEYAQWIRRAIETVDLGDFADELVEVDLEWPQELIDRLPDGFVLKLTGVGVPTHEKTASNAIASGDRARFEFRWLDKDSVVDLIASSGSGEVALWRAQRVGDLETEVEWCGRLEDLCVEPEDVESSPTDEPTNAATMRDDLRSEDLDDLLWG